MWTIRRNSVHTRLFINVILRDNEQNLLNKDAMKVVQPPNCTDMAIAWKNSCFIFSERLNFHIVVNLLIIVLALPMSVLTWLSVDEILLLRYVNWFTNFNGLSFNDDIIFIKTHELCFIWFHEEINACLLYTM